MNQGVFEAVRDEEIARAQLRIESRRAEDLRAMMATDEGRRLIHWIVYELGGLQKVLVDEPQGRRALATAVYQQLDTADPGSAEQLALEARHQRIKDDADIKSAIENRSYEYE